METTFGVSVVLSFVFVTWTIQQWFIKNVINFYEILIVCTITFLLLLWQLYINGSITSSATIANFVTATVKKDWQSRKSLLATKRCISILETRHRRYVVSLILVINIAWLFVYISWNTRGTITKSCLDLAPIEDRDYCMQGHCWVDKKWSALLLWVLQFWLF